MICYQLLRGYTERMKKPEPKRPHAKPLNLSGLDFDAVLQRHKIDLPRAAHAKLDPSYVGPHRRYNACLGCFDDAQAERDAAQQKVAELEKQLVDAERAIYRSK